ncbi:MAG TPA: rhomboid family intramembrane serine protease [Terracidiphilus sp.]|jgi:membrane associated rhomboid family serine protease
MPFSFPEFRGATRRLILVNLGAFFVMLLVQLADARFYQSIVIHCSFLPQFFLHGWIWQPFTYSLVQVGIGRTLFALLSLWFLAGFLENYKPDRWVTSLYAISVLGTALAALVIYVIGNVLHFALEPIPLMGSFGGSFGLLAVIGALYGDTEFMLFPLPISIKARYIAIIYGLITVAWLFGGERMYAFAQLGGAIAGLLYVRVAPRRGVSFAVSESWYGLRNQYYRWKRRRAGRKFEVYMRKQGRTVRLDRHGRPIDEDPDDPSGWN